MIRQTRFGRRLRPPYDPERDSKTTTLMLDVSRGLHAGLPRENLPLGFTPDAENFVVKRGALTPRGGLEMHTTLPENTLALGAHRLFDSEGGEHVLLGSERTVFLHGRASSGGWLPLGYSGSDAPLISLEQRWEGAAIYDVSTDQHVGVLTNDLNIPKVAKLGNAGSPGLSDLAGFSSLASRAKSVCAFDNRLVFFNVSTSAQYQPQRVLWSTRGQPQNYKLADGAGFEDLMDMKGAGQKVVPEKDGILLFSTHEIWRGRARYDSYAFDFTPIARDFGCPYPQTICATPAGVFFLGEDLEVYALYGDQVVALGPIESGSPSRVQSFLREHLQRPERAWALYNRMERRYELYFCAVGDAFPRSALFYFLEDNAWLPQRFAFEMPCGFEMRGTASGIRWDEAVGSWDEQRLTWDMLGAPGGAQAVYGVARDGRVLQHVAGAADDVGTPFTARWESSGLSRQNPMEHDALAEVWVHHASKSPSMLTVRALGEVHASTRTVMLADGHSPSAMVPTWAVGRAPSFELALSDGGKPEIKSVQAHLRSGGALGGMR